MIALNDVTLWRRTQEEYAYDLKRTIFAVIERRYRPPSRRKVLDRVSFRIDAGEKVGIIGPNGSGKSTTLKVIAGVLQPSRGAVSVQGKLAPLIEIGAGFDPELSVIENILYYGVLLGRDRREVRKSVDGILDFAQLFDHANEPLKALSSGMTARLGFAIATDTRPDILILDEVFSVGDEAFRRRSTERILRFWDERSTILVVSHDTGFVTKMCDRAILLEEGRLVSDGAPSDVAAVYASRINGDTVSSGHGAAHLDVETIASMEGRVFRGNGTSWDEQRIFVIRDGRKCWIRDGAWLGLHGIEWPRDVIFVEGGVLDGVPEGEPVS